MSITFSVRTEKTLKEDAEKVLNDIGLNLNTVINLMMRQVVIQKGVPFDMKSSEAATVSKVERKKMTGNINVVDAAYALAKKVYLGELDAETAAEQIAEVTGRTAATEALTIQMLCCMLRGEVYDMRRDATTTRRFLEMIRDDNDFTDVEFQNALKALKLHINKIASGSSQRNPVSLQRILFDFTTGTSEAVTRFHNYLISAGYTQTKPDGRPSTVADYISRINTIIEREDGLTWEQLPSAIDALITKYESEDVKREFGKVSHSNYIGALKAYKQMCDGE